MIPRKIRPTRLCALTLALVTVVVTAAPKLNLERVTPVPATEPIPTMDFFRPRVLQEPRLNRTGTHIAAIVTAAEDRHQLLVYELKTQKMETVGGMGDKDIYQFTWLNESRLVFGLAARKMYGLGLFATNVGSVSDPYPLQQYYGSSLVSVPLKDRLRPLVWNRWDIENQRDQGVARINTAVKSGRFVNLLSAGSDWSDAMDARDSNEKHIVERYEVPSIGLTYSYLSDREGELAYCFTGQDGQLAMFRLAEGKWVKCPVDLEQIDVVTCGDEPGQLVVIGPRQEGKPRALQLMDASTGQLGEVLLQDQAYDFSGYLYRNPTTNRILGAMFTRNGPRTAWFSEAYRNLQKILDGFFPGMSVRIIGSDEAQNLFLVATYSDRQPVIYSWVDLEKRSAGLIKSSAPWIDPQRMQPMNIIKFKTRDGRQLDGYLTMPAGATKTNPPPLVILPHGGPYVRDTWGFEGEAQFLASRGYAVLQPNYRGSTGYNWMFPEEDAWDFRKMHDDVTDAAKTMIGSGLIDKERVAIMGGSFGGYLAASGVVNEPALYRCAVTIAGVFDWELKIKSEKYDQYDSPLYGRMLKKLGDPKQKPAMFDSISPGRHVDQIRVPVFVAGGKDDQTVEIEQSKRLISDLEKYKIPYEKLLVGGEGHGMAHLGNEVELYDRIIVFLDKHVKNAK